MMLYLPRAVTTTAALDFGGDEAAADLAESQSQELDARDPLVRRVDVAIGMRDSGERVQFAADDFHDLIRLQARNARELHAVQRQVAHVADVGVRLRPGHVDIDRVVLRDPAQHALTRVFEPMPLRGAQRAATAAAIVVALEPPL